MKIIIETVPHERNRNNQVGDYRYMEDGTLYITVSDMGNEKYETLVAIHELIEERLTKWNGIKEEDINAYDEYYEKKREMGLVNLESENGFANDCIYKKEHTIATGIEMTIASVAGVDWLEYEKNVNLL